MTKERDAWVAQVREEALEPGLPICDPHHHFYARPGNSYLLEHLLQDTRAGHRIVQTVFVECSSEYRQRGPEQMRPVGETEWVRGIAVEAAKVQSATKVAAGIVGTADLRLGDAVTPVLEAHMEASGGTFRGIRHRAARDPSPDVGGTPKPAEGLLMDAGFRKGFAALHALGLGFDAWVYFHQMADVADLARAFPDTPIVFNHVGGLLGIGPYAGKRDEVLQQWKRGISEVATCPNVALKVGGLGMATSGLGFNERPKPPTSEEMTEVMGPYYRYCIEQFGPDRCMFESNFPVDGVSSSYATMWNMFKRIAQPFSASEKASMFQGTAARMYRLETLP